jgi:DUF971 family protein
VSAERSPQPINIKLRTASRLLEVSFDDGSHFDLPFEYLRAFSPSAEVKGHGGGEGVLQLGKQNVGISSLEPVGNYALRLFFDDGHNTGLYSWSVLHQLGKDHKVNWARYLERCAEAQSSAEKAAQKAAPKPAQKAAQKPAQ